MDIPWDYRLKDPPRLLDRMREEIRKRHYSRRTEEAYLAWTARFLRFRGNRHPLEVEKTDVEAFLSHLATEKRVAASTQNQALSAILFLCEHVLGRNLPWINDVVRAKKPRRLPVVLTRQEIQTILLHLHGVKWLVAMIMYAAGLRLLECLRLRVKDIDFGYRQVVVRGGRGNRDRVTALPASAETCLHHHHRGGKGTAR